MWRSWRRCCDAKRVRASEVPNATQHVESDAIAQVCVLVGRPEALQVGGGNQESV